MTKSDRKYRAFISYSHTDRAVGARLFSRIDSFRPPKSVIGVEGQFGPVPSKLYPCFRDREELSVSRDVKTSLDAALHNSDHLVVVCSPNAANSAWIAHEIRSFAEHRGPDRIHVVLVSGEPTQSLPPALAEIGLHNPLAADLRKHADGWKDGSLKTIAAILGVPFGQLRDRELARVRSRRRTAATVSAIFATVFLGGAGAGWVALDQNEQLQQMFNDAMKSAFKQQGITLTTAQMEDELTAARNFTRTAYRLAPDRPLLLLGEMRLSIVYARHLSSVGNVQGALEEIRRLRDICDRLPACETDIEARRLLGAGLRTQAALVLTLQADEPAARSLLHESVQLLTGLGDPESRRELALSEQGLGSIAIGRQDYASAYGHHRAAAAIISELIAAGHADRNLEHDHVVSLEALGDISYDRNDLVGAREFYRQANDLAGMLAAAALDQRSERDLYVTHDRLGLIALKLGDVEDANLNFDASSRLAVQLSRRDRRNVGFRRDIYVSYLQLARVAAARANEDLARLKLTEALAAASELAREDPDNLEFQADIARARIAIALVERNPRWTEYLLDFDSDTLLDQAQLLAIRLTPEVEQTLRRSNMRMRHRSGPAVCNPVTGAAC